jgi:hypothetical protein
MLGSGPAGRQGPRAQRGARGAHAGQSGAKSDWIGRIRHDSLSLPIGPLFHTKETADYQQVNYEWKQIIILVCAIIVLALILRHDLPIEFPGIMFKVLMLFVKLAVVVFLAIFAYILVGGKKSA